jgi:hypothetical protein
MHNMHRYAYTLPTHVSPRAEAPAALHRFLGGSVGSSSVFLRLADAAPGVSGWSSEVCVRAGQYLCIYHFYYIYICMEKERDSARERERKRDRDRDRERESQRQRQREREMSCIIYVYVPRTFVKQIRMSFGQRQSWEHHCINQWKQLGPMLQSNQGWPWALNLAESQPAGPWCGVSLGSCCRVMGSTSAAREDQISPICCSAAGSFPATWQVWSLKVSINGDIINHTGNVIWWFTSHHDGNIYEYTYIYIDR